MTTVCAKNKGFLYRQTRDWLVQQMRTGKLKPGSKLPGERALANSLKISRCTARAALQGLEKEGFIERIPSHGAFIKQEGEMRQIKLALVFPEAEISRECLTYANWRSSWARQQGLMNSCAKSNAYLSFLHCSPEKCFGTNGKYYVENFLNKLISEFDGAFFLAQQLPELREMLTAHNFPSLNLSNKNLLPNEKGMAYNREGICKQAAEYLIKNHCRKITMLVEHLEQNPTGQEKYKAVQQVLTNAGISFSMSDILETKNNEEETYQIFKAQYRSRNDLPDAFFCTTQIQCMILLRLAGEMGWTVPDDFFIMGYGNTSEIIRYSAVREISYIRLPYLEMGTVAGDLLTRKILSGTEIPDITIVPAELITEVVH